MSPDARDSDQRPLFGLDGRIPTVQAVTLTRQSGLTTLRKGWLPRHSAAMILLSPALCLMYKSALAAGLDGPAWNLLIAGLAVVAALTLTTYVPLRGAQRSPAASCAMMPGLLVLGAAFLLNQATGPLGGALALAVLGLGLTQRLSGTSACS